MYLTTLIKSNYPYTCVYLQCYFPHAGICYKGLGHAVLYSRPQNNQSGQKAGLGAGGGRPHLTRDRLCRGRDTGWADGQGEGLVLVKNIRNGVEYCLDI